jgi:hypothetical protein
VDFAKKNAAHKLKNDISPLPKRNRMEFDPEIGFLYLSPGTSKMVSGPPDNLAISSSGAHHVSCCARSFVVEPRQTIDNMFDIVKHLGKPTAGTCYKS